MIELSTFGESGERKVATIRRNLEPGDIERLAGVLLLEILPEESPFELDCPLQVPDLRWLYIAKCRQPLFTMVSEECLARLNYLIFADSAPSCQDLPKLGKLTELTNLYIRYQTLEDDVVDWICRQGSLLSLALTDTNVSDLTISRLTCKRCLERLHLWRSDVDFSQPELFSDEFPAVTDLDVSGTEVSADSVVLIRYLFPRLQRLLAKNTNLRRADVERLAKWSSLKLLDTGTPGVDFDRHGKSFWP